LAYNHLSGPESFSEGRACEWQRVARYDKGMTKI
jgi:hypothetical protein